MHTENQRLHTGVRKMAPCKTCTEKYSACHDVCERFKDWKAETDKDKAALKKYEDYYYKSPRKYLDKFKKG